MLIVSELLGCNDEMIMVESRGQDKFMAQAGLDHDKTQAASSPWTNYFRGLSQLRLELGLACGNTNPDHSYPNGVNLIW